MAGNPPVHVDKTQPKTTTPTNKKISHKVFTANWIADTSATTTAIISLIILI